jgi:diguanylate cyclase (GGDEF)-like protein
MSRTARHGEEGTEVADGQRAVPVVVALALADLTEQALHGGLEAAIQAAVPVVADALDATVSVELGSGEHPPAVEVDGPDAAQAAATAALLASAVQSAQRALAAHAADRADVAELRALARVDPLTGALNRRAFLQELDEAVARARRRDEPVTLVMCDVDGLKAINDRHGHPAGDEALRAFVDALSANLRTSDSVGRVGGDEFALLLRGAEAEATAAILCRLTATIRDDADGVGDVRASFGSARCPDDGTTRDALVAVADARLYEAKRVRG